MFLNNLKAYIGIFQLALMIAMKIRFYASSNVLLA